MLQRSQSSEASDAIIVVRDEGEAFGNRLSSIEQGLSRSVRGNVCFPNEKSNRERMTLSGHPKRDTDAINHFRARQRQQTS